MNPTLRYIPAADTTLESMFRVLTFCDSPGSFRSHVYFLNYELLDAAFFHSWITSHEVWQHEEAFAYLRYIYLSGEALDNQQLLSYCNYGLGMYSSCRVNLVLFCDFTLTVSGHIPDPVGISSNNSRTAVFLLDHNRNDRLSHLNKLTLTRCLLINPLASPGEFEYVGCEKRMEDVW
ncbi:hypothetical protein CsSME_00017140 [Camellia sinensis var. sinensis]